MALPEHGAARRLSLPETSAAPIVNISAVDFALFGCQPDFPRANTEDTHCANASFLGMVQDMLSESGVEKRSRASAKARLDHDSASASEEEVCVVSLSEDESLDDDASEALSERMSAKPDGCPSQAPSKAEDTLSDANLLDLNAMSFLSALSKPAERPTRRYRESLPRQELGTQARPEIRRHSDVSMHRQAVSARPWPGVGKEKLPKASLPIVFEDDDACDWSACDSEEENRKPGPQSHSQKYEEQCDNEFGQRTRGVLKNTRLSIRRLAMNIEQAKDKPTAEAAEYHDDDYEKFAAPKSSPLKPKRNSYISRVFSGQVRESSVLSSRADTLTLSRDTSS